MGWNTGGGGGSGTTTLHAVSAYLSAGTSNITGTFTPVPLDTELLDTDGYHFTSNANLTGTVTKTAASASLVGVGTAFTTELSVGQVISIPGVATELGAVKVIVDDTHLTLWNPLANSSGGQTAQRVSSAVSIPSGLGGKYSLHAGAYHTFTLAHYADLRVVKNGGATVADVRNQYPSAASTGDGNAIQGCDCQNLILADGDILQVGMFANDATPAVLQPGIGTTVFQLARTAA